MDIIVRGSGGSLTSDVLELHAGQRAAWQGNDIFTDAYHPNADKWTTARTLTLSGDVTGSASFDGSANATITTAVANNSHNHTYSIVSGITNLDSVPDTHTERFRPFISEFQASNRSGSNYNGGFEVGTRAAGYGSQFVFEANGTTTPPRFRNKVNGTWGSWQYIQASGETFSSLINGNKSGGNVFLGTTANNATKWSAVTARQYAHNSEQEGYTLVSGAASSAANNVYLGGGLDEQNAATIVQIRAASNTSTRNGTEIVRVTTDGLDIRNNVLRMTGTTVIDASRNITAGTISSGNITSGAISSTGNTHYLGGIKIKARANGENYIAFGGTTGDQPNNYNHTYIGEHIYNSTEQSELLLAKFNDAETTAGPDRIRLQAPNIVFDVNSTTITPGTNADLSSAAGTGTVTTAMKIRQNGDIEVGGSKFIDSGRNLSNIGSIATGTVDISEGVNSGNFVNFKKGDGTVIGKIAYSASDNLSIQSTVANHAGINFGTNIIVPMSAGVEVDNTVELGDGTRNMKAVHTKSIKVANVEVLDSNRNFSGTSLTLSDSGTSTSPVLGITSTNSTTFIHASNAFAANMTAGQFHGHFFGKAGSTKNAGGLGYYWAASGSDSNFVSIGHWGADHLLRLYGNGNFNIHNGALQLGGTTVIDSSRNLTNIGTISSGAITATGNLSLSGDSRKIEMLDGTTSSQPSIAIGEQSLYGFRQRWDSGQKVIYEGWWASSTSGAVNRDFGHLDLYSKKWRFNDYVGINVDANTTYRLYVNGNIRADGAYYVGGDQVITSAKVLTNIASATVTNNLSAGSLTTDYGLSLTNGNTDFLLYNNTNENVLYMRDTTNGAMLQTWHTDKVQMNKNLSLSGALMVGNTTVIDSSRNLTNIGTISSGGITANGDLYFSKSPDPRIYAGTNVGLNIDGQALYLNRNTNSNILVGSGSAPATLSGLNVHMNGSSYVLASDGTRSAFMGADSSGYAMFGSLTNHDAVIRTNNAERIRVATNGNVTFKGDTFTFHGSGANTYTSTAIYINQTYGVLIEGSLQSNSSGATKNPLVLTWRGNWNTQGGIKVEAGKTTVDSLHIKSGNSSVEVIDSSRNVTVNTLVTNGDITFNNSGTTKRGIRGTMGDNDHWFIGGGATASNAGYMEIAVGDDGQSTVGGDEQIYFSQYGPGSPWSGTLVRRHAMFDGYGRTIFNEHRSPTGSNPIGPITPDTCTICINSPIGGHNYLQFHNDTDDGTLAGLVFSDNNHGGSVLFANAGYSTGLADVLHLSGYQGVDIRAGTGDARLPTNKTRIANFGTASITLDKNTSVTGTLSCTGNLTVSSSNATGGGIILADDGDIVDLNDAYCSMRFSYGVRVYSANRGGSVRHTLHSNGNFTATGNVTAYSDIRLKENITPITDAVEKVNKINGVTYNRNDLDDSEKRFTGVIAQEVEQVLPEVVDTDDQGIKNVAYGNMVGLLIEAIKEQSAQIESLNKRIEELENGNN